MLGEISMNKILNRLKILDRLQEPSSWRGLVMFATAFGVGISPEMMEQIIIAGTATAGLLGMLTADKPNG